MAPSETAPPAIHPHAERLAQEGLEEYALGRYARAIEKFERAYELTPAPLLLYNLAQAHRLAGECVQAVHFYERFLATNPSGRSAELAARKLAELAPCAGLPEPPPEQVAQGRAPEKLNLPEPVREPERAPWIRAPATEGRASSAAAEGRGIHLGASILGGSALVLVSAGGYFGWQARKASDDVSKTFDGGGTWNERAAERESAGKRFETMSVVALAAGVVAGGVSACLFVFD